VNEKNPQFVEAKILAVMVAMIMALGLTATNVFAEGAPGDIVTDDIDGTPSITIKSTANPDDVQEDTTAYIAYQILEADIVDETHVSYYVTTQDRVDALSATGLFTVTQVGSTNKWIVELKEKSPATNGDDIAAAFGASTFDLSKFGKKEFAKNGVADATTGAINAGYYYVTSTAGTKAVVQTLGAVTIYEKNTYPPVEKTIADEDKNAQIGDEINYTLTVEVPATANAEIVLTDTMDEGLTFKAVGEAKNNNNGTVEKIVSAVDKTTNSFTITFTADTVIANQGKTITIPYTAVLNEKAKIETNIPNTVDLKYGNNYRSKPKTVNTKTYKLEFDKVDGANNSNRLSGAEFQLTIDGTPVRLVEEKAGETYRVALADETNTVDKIVTAGKVITINGLDLDTNYQLVEIKAPAGYNQLDQPVNVTVDTTTHLFARAIVENNAGAELPSTGGIGTTIFYAIGSVLVVGAGILLISKKRMFN